MLIEELELNKEYEIHWSFWKREEVIVGQYIGTNTERWDGPWVYFISKTEGYGQAYGDSSMSSEDIDAIASYYRGEMEVIPADIKFIHAHITQVIGLVSNIRSLQEVVIELENEIVDQLFSDKTKEKPADGQAYIPRSQVVNYFNGC